ncbi:MAG TPA: hypothetical protein VK894_00535 [Jiangellales bacterium]|nr:hypothetical protein [Jiangellales bacterium]
MLLALPRRVLLLVTGAQVRELLERSPEPFTPAGSEKRAALAHFQPRGVLISRGEVRSDRRRFTEAVLETYAPAHHLAPGFVRAATEEVDRLLAQVTSAGEIDWEEWHAMFGGSCAEGAGSPAA